MALNFPSSPTLNDEYTLGTKTWVWNGSAWALKVAEAQSATLGAIPVGGGMQIDPSLVTNNMYSGTDGTKWQMSGVPVAYDPTLHDLVKLPDSSKSYAIQSTPSSHSTSSYTSNNSTIDYYSSNNLMLSRIVSVNYGSPQSFYSTACISFDKGITWNYTLGVPVQLVGTPSISPSGVVTLAGSGTAGATLSVFSGTSWSTYSSLGGVSVFSITYSVYDTVLSKFVVFFTGPGNTGLYVATSTNGTTWSTTTITSGSASSAYIAYNSTLSMYIYAYYNFSTYLSATSTNLTTWTSTGVSGSYPVVTNSGIFTMVNPTNGTVYYSANGTSWTTGSTYSGYNSLQKNGPLISLVSYSSGYPVYKVSTTGSTWLDISTYGGGSFQLVDGYYLNDAVSIPSNLSTYTAISGYYASRAISYNSLTVVAGSGANSNKVYTSSTGLTTTSPVLTITGANWISFGIISGKLYAFSNVAVYSTLNGSTWTQVTTYSDIGGTYPYYTYVGTSSVAISGGSIKVVTSDNMIDYYTTTFSANIYPRSTDGTDVYASYLVSPGVKYVRLTDLSPSGAPSYINMQSNVSALMRTK